MDWLGWASVSICILIGYYSSYPRKVKKLEGELKKLKRNQMGETKMSKILTELIGKDCIIETDCTVDFQCTVMDVDEGWIKIMYMDKDVQKIKVLRIESIQNVELNSE